MPVREQQGLKFCSVSSRFRFILVLEFWVLGIPNPRAPKRFPLNTTFLYVEVPSLTGLSVIAYIGCTITLTALLGVYFPILRCKGKWLFIFLITFFEIR